ncbi:basic-leucine zipper transcription factor [Phycomyces blakesleeanus]
MSFPFSTFMSPLDSLVFDIPTEQQKTEQDAADELDLWTNAQFTFDVKPGSGIFEDDKTCSSATSPSVSAPSASFLSTPQFQPELDPITYENLVNYLDYELPQQQQQQQQQLQQQQVQQIQPKQTQQQRPVPRTIVPVVEAPVATPARQLLLPKPPTMDASQLVNLLSQSLVPSAPLTVQHQPKQRKKSSIIAPTTTTTPTLTSANTTATSLKRAPDEVEEEFQAADEDKRRRNTAASARFRIKKKQREQAMEQTVREMTSKSDALQERVNELELEVKWLRGLLTEKDTKSSD